MPRRHLLGIDDAPFDKFTSPTTPLVGVWMEGHDLVEGVATTEFAVDGPDVTDFLADWVRGLRAAPAIQGVVLGGITIAGLGVVDLPALSAALSLPVLNVSRREPTNDALCRALQRAGLADRIEIVERAPRHVEAAPSLWVAAAGLGPEEAVAWVRAARHKSGLPEPLRLAHLVAAALTRGESRGRP